MQAFLNDGNQHVSAGSDPDLRLHGVLARTQKSFDAQVLLYPFEEQLHLPSLPIQIGNQLGFQGEIVGEKCNALFGLVFEDHAPQCSRVVFARNVKTLGHY